MKTARFLLLAWSFALSAFGAAPVNLSVETNGVLRAPTEFFTANQSAITALSSGVYQPLDADLTALAGISGVSGDIIYHNGSTWVRLAKGTNGQSLQLSAGFPTWATVVGGSGVGDVTLAGTNAFTGPNSFAGVTTFNGAANLNGSTTISNLTVPGTLSVGSITSDTPLGMAIGGTGGTNAASARASLGVTYDVDVQAYRLGLLQAALALTADGHMLVRNGTLVTNLTSTAAGRALLTAASASEQWNSYLLSVASTNGGYDATSWNGISNRLVTLDQFRDAINALPGGSNAITSVTSPLSLSNGVLSIDTTGLGGGGGGVTWIVNESLGSWYGRDSTTNWPLLSVTISSNNLPTTTGKYLFGHVSGIISNLSGTTATVYYNADVNGVRVFRDSCIVNGTVPARGRPFIGEFYLVYETASTASLIQIGTHVSSSNPDIGGSGDIANNAVAFQFIATNIVVNWSSNITLALGFECDASTSTNSALGLRKVSASLLKYSAATGTGNVTGPASSTNNAIVLFGSTGGTNIIDSGVLVSDLAPKASPALTGDPTAPTASPGDKDTSIATTAFVENVRTNLDAGNVTSGTLASNRLPAAISLTSLSAGTLTATSVSGDGSGLTNLNGSNIASGTVAASRVDTAIARTNAPTLHSPVLLTPTGEAGGLTVAAASGATNATQLVTLAQLQSAVRGGIVSHFDVTTPATGFTLTGTVGRTNRNSITALSTASTNTGTALVTGDYVAAFITTNTYSSIASGLAAVEIYAFESAAGSPQISAEVYAINSVTKAEEREFTPSSAFQTVAAGSTPTLLNFSIPLTDYSSTTNFHLAVKLKQNNSGTVKLVTGGAYDSHLSFALPSQNFVLNSGSEMTGALSNQVSVGAPVIYSGTTNLGSELALKAPLASPTLASPTLNDTVAFEQTILSAHSTVTNFVADPTVSPYQTINADLTTPFATVGFLHATNVAAGRQTTILVFAGTNASVTVSLAAQFARNTNSVALTTGQILPISFYGYGSSPTNVVATMGTVYTR